tara:strand:- start:89769 stop:90695 length:927 start_codon:yes stop_codon:yes gene_type:complete
LPFPKNILKFIEKFPTLTTIGNTPTAEINFPELKLGNSKLFAKYEFLNPGGSIKDRPILRMLVDAILTNKLDQNKTILDATSGNAGIAYAMIGTTLDRKVELVMPENASEERKKRLIAHGAKLTFTDPLLGYDETIREVRRLYENNPEKYFWCNQYSNPMNPLAHFETTSEELLNQVTDITHFVAGVGTGGTISGIGKKLKQFNPKIKIILINFDEWPGIEGLKPIGDGHYVPDIFDQNLVDDEIHVDIDNAANISKMLASKGLFVGQSSGAYITAAIQVCHKEQNNSKVVTILNDIGERYFSTGIWG